MSRREEKNRVLPAWPIVELTQNGAMITAAMLIASGRKLGKTASRPMGESMGSCGGELAAEIAAGYSLRMCRVRAIDASGTVSDLAVDVREKKLLELGADGSVKISVPVSATTRRGTGRFQNLQGNKVAGIAAFALIGAILIGGGSWFVNGIRGATSAGEADAVTAGPAVTPAQLPQLPPPGFDTYAAWSVPLESGVFSTARPVVTVVDDTVWTATGATVTARSASTGAQLSTVELDFQVSKIVRTDLGEGPVIAAAGGSSVQGLNTDGTGGRRIDFGPDVASVSFAGDRPLGSAEPEGSPITGKAWTVQDDGTTGERLIPAGAQALAGVSGSVFATDTSRGLAWWVTSDALRLPEPLHVLLPESAGKNASLTKGRTQVIDGYWVVEATSTASGLFGGSATGAVKVEENGLGSWLPFTESGAGVLTAFGGDGATLGIQGDLLCAGGELAWNLATAAPIVLPKSASFGWQGLGCGGGRLWLSSQDTSLALSPDGTVLAESETVTTGEVLGVAENGLAMIIADEGQGSRLFALEPHTALAEGTRQ